jgi:hypothetical protein
MSKGYKSSAKIACLLVVLFIIDTSLLFFWRQATPNSFLADQILFVAIVTASAFTLVLFVLKSFLSKKRSKSFAIESVLHMISQRFVMMLLLISFVSSTVLIQTQTLLNIDRSRSYFILEWIGCSPSKELTLIENKVEATLGKGELAALNLRLVEQESRGFIAREGDIVKLTRLGSFLFKFSEVSAGIFKLSGWETNKVWKDTKC